MSEKPSNIKKPELPPIKVPKINFNDKLPKLKANTLFKKLPIKTTNLPVNLKAPSFSKVIIQDKIKKIPIHLTVPKAKLDLKQAIKTIPISKVSSIKISADLAKKAKIKLPKANIKLQAPNITQYVRIDKKRGVLIIDDKAIKEKLSNLFKKNK